ncbi:O-antigen translocase [Chthonobacter rhizosphaerae]|uniref:O-antigen translocase n=1 Tax=Chthonobacter rhizosphaerae TaxID=2735553 RepID=UPI0015EEA154|nr:O-antigen translocase [Chthonobacter rhizosphaerae]
MAEPSSHRHILRAVALLGSSSAVQVVIGILRVKLIAVLIGPAGAGLVGLYSAVLAMTSTFAGFGLSHGGVRELAAEKENRPAADEIRRTLFWGGVVLGVLGALAVVLLRHPIAEHMVGDPSRADDVAWLGVGTVLTVIAAGQTALLSVLGPVRDLAVIGVVSTVIASVVGIGMILLAGLDGAVWVVIALPLASVLVGAVYGARLPRPAWPPVRVAGAPARFGGMIRLGIAVTIAGVVGSLAQVLVRTAVTDELGLDAVGHFQAAWAISMQYLGFVLATMAVDYYPRLSAVVADREKASALVNDQTEVALLLAGPFLVGGVALAPVVIPILYSAAFAEAVPVLRWQIVGDVFKLAAWPIGFLLLSQRSSRWFVITDALWGVLYVAFVVVALPRLGLLSTGVGFAAAYLVYFLAVLAAAARIAGHRPTRRNVGLIGLNLVLIGAVYGLCAASPLAGAIVGCAVAALYAGMSAVLISNRVDPSSRLGRVYGRIRHFARRRAA